MLDTHNYYRRPRKQALKRTAKLCGKVFGRQQLHMLCPITITLHSLQDLCVGGGGGGVSGATKNVCRRKLTGLIYSWLINGPLIISRASQAQTISPSNGLQRTHTLCYTEYYSNNKTAKLPYTHPHTPLQKPS